MLGPTNTTDIDDVINHMIFKTCEIVRTHIVSKIQCHIVTHSV